MNLGVRLKCPPFECRCRKESPNSGLWRVHGRFYRRSDSRFIVRWICTRCRKTSSQATLHPCYRQKKRRKNFPLYQLLCSGVSLRRAAKLLNIHRTTVVRKFRFLAEQARRRHEAFLKELEATPLDLVQFGEMETFEHSKLKPLSIPLAVTKKRVILGAGVATMPAKGLIADKSRKKYGKRKDERGKAISDLLSRLKGLVVENVKIKTDQCPRYPPLIAKFFPLATHETTAGLRGCVVGQGELKATSWDPIFSLNHTAAMFRANLNRLFRRTWCTTKTKQGALDHLALYIDYHNRFLLKSCH